MAASGKKNMFNEATRVQMPAMVHLTRLGYTYFGKITEDMAGTVYDPDTNILINVFKEQFARLNPTHAGEAEQTLKTIRQELDNDDIGRSFYERLSSVSPVRLVDFENPKNNTYHFTAEFTCKRDQDEFRPDGWAFKGEYFAEDGEQSILTPGNFFEKGGFKPNNGKERYYTGTYPKEYLCHKGDLIVAMTQQAEGLLGSTALVPENNKYLHNQRIGLITCDEKRLNKLFAYYLFMTKSVREQLERSSSGTKVKHTSPEKIYDVEVEIPDVISQQKIANLLWAIDEKIANNKAINDNLPYQSLMVA